MMKDDKGRALTKEQQQYFKNSIARDTQGHLLTVYHSTNATFTIFDSKLGESVELGYHFGTHKAAADRRGIYMLECYLNIENVLVAPTDINYWDTFGLMDLMLNHNMIKDLTNTEYEFLVWLWNSAAGYDPDEDLEQFLLDNNMTLSKHDPNLIHEDETTRQFDTHSCNEYRDEVRDIIYSRGYDGITYVNGAEDPGSMSWIIFNPNQVKLVTNKTPTLSKSMVEMRQNTMKKFNEKIEQGYKDIEWELRLGGTIPAEMLLEDSGNIDWLLRNICEIVADDIILSPDMTADGFYYTTVDDVEVTFIIHGWTNLSFGAQSVIIHEIYDALQEGNYSDITTVADFFDEDAYIDEE